MLEINLYLPLDAEQRHDQNADTKIVKIKCRSKGAKSTTIYIKVVATKTAVSKVAMAKKK